MRWFRCIKMKIALWIFLFVSVGYGSASGGLRIKPFKSGLKESASVVPEAVSQSAKAEKPELTGLRVDNPILRKLDAKRLEDLMLTKPDYVVYVPKQEMRLYKKTNPQEIGDRYNDHFQVLYDDSRKLYYAFWTQASWEGAGDHHIVFSKSADGGHTWTEPVTLAGSERRAYKRMGASWQQPML